jgi:hypothetical protein
VERGQSVSGEVESGEVDRYQFSAATGDVVYLDATSDCVEGLWWRLLTPAGGLLTFDRT